MKQSDVTAKTGREREDWQKRGVGGLVTAADALAAASQFRPPGWGEITIS